MQKFVMVTVAQADGQATSLVVSEAVALRRQVGPHPVAQRAIAETWRFRAVNRVHVPPSSMSGWRRLRWRGGESPFGPALVKTPRSVAGLRQLAHRLVCECAEGSAAVGDDLAVPGQIRKVLVELLDGDRARALDMPEIGRASCR